MPILDLNEAAGFLLCHVAMLLKKIKEDPTLPCAKVGEDYRFIQADLEVWIRSHYTPEAQELLNTKGAREQRETDLFASSMPPRTLEEQVHELLGNQPSRRNISRRRPRSDKSVEEVLTEIQARKTAKKYASSST